MSVQRSDGAGAPLDRLLRSASIGEQRALREALGEGDDVVSALGSLFFQNPFFRLTDSEAETLRAGIGSSPLAGLVAARHHAMQASASRYVVFCMPKSGSTFLKAALVESLQLPPVSLTSFGNTELSSMFGMNPREQELDELALVKAALMAPDGYIAQHHTRYTPYLALQMRTYGLTPIVTIRNIPDALVSFDDMMLAWRASAGWDVWTGDGPFALPRDYTELSPEARIRVIAPSLGVWMIQFHLSWLRGARQAICAPLVIRYEQDVLYPAHLVARLREALGLDEMQTARLQAFAERPDLARSRFNVGKRGRGRERVPDDVRAFLVDYARNFAGEIPDDDVAYLLD
ncbi:MAG: hypothetical protein ACXWKM_04765 [Phenylobacterium sp.]